MHWTFVSFNQLKSWAGSDPSLSFLMQWTSNCLLFSRLLPGMILPLLLANWAPWWGSLQSEGLILVIPKLSYSVKCHFISPKFPASNLPLSELRWPCLLLSDKRIPLPRLLFFPEEQVNPSRAAPDPFPHLSLKMWSFSASPSFSTSSSLLVCFLYPINKLKPLLS